MRVKIGKVEQALTAEVKRRVDATHSSESKAKIMVEKMEERLTKRLQDQTESMSGRMKELEDRLNALEVAQEQDSRSQNASIQERGTELKLQLQDLSRDLDQEKKARLVREGRFLQQMESHAKDLEGKWRQEQEERINPPRAQLSASDCVRILQYIHTSTQMHNYKHSYTVRNF